MVAFVSTKDEGARVDLMLLPCQRSWGSVLEVFVRHCDRKCLFDPEGRMVRRHILVRSSKIVGLGKEANRIEARRVLGQQAVGGRAKTYVDWKARLLAMGRVEARRLGLPWSSVTGWKRSLKRTSRLRADALQRLKRALVAPPPPLSPHRRL